MEIRQLVALTTLLALAESGAFGQGTGGTHDWYVSVDYGESKLDSTGSLVNAVSRNDDSDTVSIRIGYRFSRKFALEAGYIDFGGFSASFVAACPACLPRRARTPIDGFLVNVIGIWPIHEHFQLKGALGTTYRELEATAVYPAMTDHWSDTGRVSVPLSPRLGFIDQGEFWLTTLALRFRF